jgi:predicted nuclease of predicted toxin-antitoxin system
MVLIASVTLGFLIGIIWLRLGNCSTSQVEGLLRRDFNAIELFYRDANLSLIALS